METNSIVDVLTSNHIPELTLAIGGIVAILIACFYFKDKESTKYKFSVFVGLIAGVLMAVIAFSMFGAWGFATSILIILASFTLIIRPFRDVQIALIIAIMAVIIVYVLLAGLADTWFNFLAEGWPRIIVAFLCGALIYMILHFAEALLKIAGKTMNAWPLLFILGTICITEAVMIFMGYDSLFDYIREYLDGRSIIT